MDYFPEILCFQGIIKGGDIQTRGWRQCRSRSTAGRTLGGRQPGMGLGLPAHSNHRCTVATRSLGWGLWCWKTTMIQQQPAGVPHACYPSKDSSVPRAKWKRRVSRSVSAAPLQRRGLWPTRLLCPCSSPGKNTGVSCHALLQRIFPIQGLNPGLLHCRQILSHKGSLLPSTAKRDLNQGYLTSSLVLICHRKGS